MRETLQFLVEFFRRPQNTGAIAPSSEALAREMVTDLGLAEASLVVEYGPGSGAFTGNIIGKIPEDTDFIAIENNERMVSLLREQHPTATVVNESIADATDILHEHGHAPGSVDSIVSGLPWASFPDDLQDRLLDATLEILADDGKFATFAYVHGLVLPTAEAFRRKLESRFSTVNRSPIVWKNLPPAFIYRCEK